MLKVKEAFPDPYSKHPIGHRPEPGDWVLWKHQQRKTTIKLHWKGPYQMFLTTDIAKLEGTEPCIHISQLKTAPPDLWSCADAGDLKVKSKREDK